MTEIFSNLIIDQLRIITTPILDVFLVIVVLVDLATYSFLRNRLVTKIVVVISLILMLIVYLIILTSYYHSASFYNRIKKEADCGFNPSSGCLEK